MAPAVADGVATPKKARTALRRAPAPKEEPGREAVAAGEEPATLDVTLLAPDALECHLCSAPFEAAIFQASRQPRRLLVLYCTVLAWMLLIHPCFYFFFHLSSARTGTRRAGAAATACRGCCDRVRGT